MSIRLSIFFLNTLLIYGQQNTGVPVIQVNEKLETVELKLSDICSDISYTKLEFDDKYPVARIYNLHVTNEYIFFLNTYTILRYTRDGKKVIKIGSIGQGTGEYLGGSSFVVDEKNQKMYIRVNFTKNFLAYDYVLNKYLYKFELPFDDFGGMPVVMDGIIVVTGSTNRRYSTPVGYFSLKLLDSKDGKVLYEKTNPDFIKPKSEHRWQGEVVMGGATIFWKDTGNSYYSFQEIGSDTIYCMSSELKTTPRFIVNCPIRDQGENTASFYAETSKYLFGNLYNSNTNKVLLGYDKEMKKSFIYKQFEFEGFSDAVKSITKIRNRGVINDLDGGLPVIIPYSSHSSSHWHIFVEPFDLIEYVNSPEFKQAVVKDPKKKEELERFVKTLVEDDNPVLVTLTLK